MRILSVVLLSFAFAACSGDTTKTDENGTTDAGMTDMDMTDDMGMTDTEDTAM